MTEEQIVITKLRKEKNELIDAHTQLLKQYKTIRERLTIAMKKGNLTMNDIK